MSDEKKKQQRHEWLNNLIDEKLEEATNEIQNTNHNFARKMLNVGDICPDCNVVLQYDTFNRQLTCGCDLMKF